MAAFVRSTVLPIRTVAAALFRPTRSLGRRTGQSAFWYFTARWLDRLCVIARLVLVAAFLRPDQLGLVSVAMFAVNVLELLTQSGVQQALVQRRDITRTDLDVGWSILVVRGTLLSAIVVVSAPLIATFFHSPTAVVVIRILGLAPFLTGLTNVGIVLFERDLEFRRRTVYQVGGTVADLGLSVGLVALLDDPLGLALGITGGHVARVVLSYLIHPYRPRPRLDLAAARALLAFGRWVSLSWGFVFVAIQGAEAVVGKLLGADTLALYQNASRLADLPASEITAVIEGVAFPAYARAQDDPRLIALAYRRAVRVVTFVTFPLAALLIGIAEPLTHLFFHADWYGMVPLIRILALAGAMRSAISLGSPLFLATNSTRFEVLMQGSRLATLAVTIGPATLWWGIEGTCWATVLAMLACFPFWVAGSRRLSGGTRWSVVEPLLANGILGGIAGGTVYLVASQAGLPLLLGVVVAPILGLGAVLVAAIALERLAGYGAWSDVRLLAVASIKAMRVSEPGSSSLARHSSPGSGLAPSSADGTTAVTSGHAL